MFVFKRLYSGINLRKVSCEVIITIVLAQGTVVEGTIQKLFEGHHMNYIECINVEFKSTRKESFYGIVCVSCSHTSSRYFIIDAEVYNVCPCGRPST